MVPEDNHESSLNSDNERPLQLSKDVKQDIEPMFQSRVKKPLSMHQRTKKSAIALVCNSAKAERQSVN